MVFVVQIHNYFFFGADSLNYKRNIDSFYSQLIKGERIRKTPDSKNMFGGYRINNTIFNKINSLTVHKFLSAYFDREGNVKTKQNENLIEVWAVCYLNNITFYLDTYYYPAIHEATWNELKRYYPDLNKLPKPKQTRYIE